MDINFSTSRRIASLVLWILAISLIFRVLLLGNVVLPIIILVFLITSLMFTHITGDHDSYDLWPIAISLVVFSMASFLLSQKNLSNYFLLGFTPVVIAGYLRQSAVHGSALSGAILLGVTWAVPEWSYIVYSPGVSISEFATIIVFFTIGYFLALWITTSLRGWNATQVYENIGATEQVIDEYLHKSEIPYLMYLKPVADNMTRLSSHIEKTSKENLGRIVGQSDKIVEVNRVVKDLESTFHETANIIDQTKKIAQECKKISDLGKSEIHTIMQMVKKLVSIIEITRDNVKDLKDSTRRVESVINVIDKIANQTRLLSLNASIEAARFSKGQRGFVMVADEVKVLSVLTQLSVQDITNTVRDIKVKTKSVEEIIEKEATESLKGLDIARLGEQSIKYVESIVGSLESEINVMRSDFESNRDEAVGISDKFNNIQVFVDENEDRMKDLAIQIEDMKAQAANVMTIVESVELGELTNRQNDKVFSLMNRMLLEIESVFDEGVRNKSITVDDLFDREYEPIENSRDLFRSKCDRFIENQVQPALDEHVEKIDRFVYFYMVDSEGYAPAHNRIFSQELTGEASFDEKMHRGKRMYRDYATTAALHSEDIYLLQCIRHTSESEPIMDMSVPVYYDERRWGILRAGFVYR